MDGDRLRVETSGVYAITLTGGGDRWQSGPERHSEDGEPIFEAEFDLEQPRVVVTHVKSRLAECESAA